VGVERPSSGGAVGRGLRQGRGEVEEELDGGSGGFGRDVPDSQGGGNRVRGSKNGG